MPSSVNVPVVDQQRDPLARGQLAGVVLARDLLLAAAEPRRARRSCRSSASERRRLGGAGSALTSNGNFYFYDLGF